MKRPDDRILRGARELEQNPVFQALMENVYELAQHEFEASGADGDEIRRRAWHLQDAANRIRYTLSEWITAAEAL